MRARVRLFLASSNPGKLAEYRALARAAELASPGDVAIALELLPGFESLPAFEENAPTFAENVAGKALYYSRFCDWLVFADDSGLVVPALGGAPGVLSARYAGPGANSAERNAKLLREMRGKSGRERAAYFVCAIGLAERGRAKAIVSGRVDGEILEAPRGDRGGDLVMIPSFTFLCWGRDSRRFRPRRRTSIAIEDERFGNCWRFLSRRSRTTSRRMRGATKIVS